jgi:2-polyprenyl-3-methyl-5-hydroxy-6-metoxy-1,4-benzoquinol methylase
VNPQPLEEEVKKRYGGAGYGEDYFAYELANEDNFLNLQLLALADTDFGELESELKQNNRKPRALDIGCATGSLLAVLRERGWECTGVEICGPQAEYAKKRRNLDVRSLPLEENHFPDSSFDVVLASHLIEHLNDPAGLARELRRILVPGGHFFVTTPNIAGFQARLFKKRWRSAIFDHLYLFSVKTLSRLLRENGFAIEKISSWGGLALGTAPAPVKRLFDKAAKRFGFGDVMIIRGRAESANWTSYLCTLPDASPATSFFTSSTETKL